MSEELPQNLALLRAAFGSGPLYAATEDDLITFEGVEILSGYDHASTPDRFVIVKQPPHRDAFVELCRRFTGGRIIELGIAEGGSTVLAALAAEPSALVAVDLEPVPNAALATFLAERGLTDRIHARYGVDQADRDQLTAVVDDSIGPEPVDLIVDDASHQLAPTRTSFEVLFPRLRPGGVYAIEDWNADHAFKDAVIEHFRNASPEERAELAASLRSAPDAAAAPARRPLLDLAVELLLARARTEESAIAEVRVTPYWLMAVRGPGEIDPATFRLDDLAHDHFHYLD